VVEAEDPEVAAEEVAEEVAEEDHLEEEHHPRAQDRDKPEGGPN